MAHQGDMLKTILRVKNITQENFAKSLGVSRQTVINWFDKLRLPKKQIPKIESLLNVKFSDLSNAALKSQFEIGAPPHSESRAETPDQSLLIDAYREQIQTLKKYVEVLETNNAMLIEQLSLKTAIKPREKVKNH